MAVSGKPCLLDPEFVQQNCHRDISRGNSCHFLVETRNCDLATRCPAAHPLFRGRDFCRHIFGICRTCFRWSNRRGLRTVCRSTLPAGRACYLVLSVQTDMAGEPVLQLSQMGSRTGRLARLALSDRRAGGGARHVEGTTPIAGATGSFSLLCGNTLPGSGISKRLSLRLLVCCRPLPVPCQFGNYYFGRLCNDSSVGAG